MVAGLKTYQKEIAQETLYQVSCKAIDDKASTQKIAEQLRPTIQIYGGNAGDVYGSQVLPTNPPEGMPKIFTALNGIAAIDFMPNYLYVDPVSSDIETIVVSGVQATALSLIAAGIEVETYVAADLELD